MATKATSKAKAVKEEIREIGRRAREAALELGRMSGAQRKAALLKMKDRLVEARGEVMAANADDVAKARDELGLDGPMLKRLAVTDKVFDYMCGRLAKVAALDDPVGKVLEGHTEPTGLQVERVSVPLGVVAIVYESRPNVTTDAASVCLKSGNAVILRGGKESSSTNRVLAGAMVAALRDAGLPQHAVQLVDAERGGHEAVDELLKLDDCVDVVVPRGGKNLIAKISEGTSIPVIRHYEGICHQYLAADAPRDWARDVAVNSKCQSVEVCNAMETLLVDAAHLKAEAEVPVTEANGNSPSSPPNLILDVCRAFAERGVEIRGCPKLVEYASMLKGRKHDANGELIQEIAVVPATDEDWSTEYLAPIISVKVVDGVDEAIRHINKHGSGHTDGIVTSSLELSRQFVDGVDSASVLVNASTRLSGGGDYGMGAVVGISTGKLHARGPVGPAELTTYKWVVRGRGHLRG